MKKSLCIIAFSFIHRDARVLRQVKYLAPHYQLTVIGYGDADPGWRDQAMLTWVSVAPLKKDWLTQLIGLALLILGKWQPALYRRWYWRKPHHRFALETVQASGCAAIHANDWDTLPIAVEAAKKTGAAVVFDAHEYAPLQFENFWFWRWLHAPAIRYLLRQYTPSAEASLTVAPLIAQRYQQEFGLKPVVVLNTPDDIALPLKTVNCEQIRLVHHGVSNRNRRLETMIETLALCDQRYSLHFILVENDPEYLQYLKKLAGQITPGRVEFCPPLAVEEIIQHLANYDIGFCLLPPTTYNLEVSLPNKFFDYIIAGLAVCIGPSPSMVEITRQYQLGCIAPTFAPRDVAQVLNQLTTAQIAAMQQAARAAVKQFRAGQEMGKVVELYRRLLPE